MKRILVTITILLALVGCQENNHTNDVLPDTKPVVENSTSTDEATDSKQNDESESEKEVLEKPVYRGESVYRKGHDVFIKPLFNYKHDIAVFYNGEPLTNIRSLPVGENELEAYTLKGDEISESIFVTLEIIAENNEDYVVLFSRTDDQSTAKVVSKSEINTYTEECYYVIRNEGMNYWLKYTKNSTEYYEKVSGITRDDLSVCTIKDEYPLLIYKPESDFYEQSYKLDKLLVYSIDRLWEQDRTTFFNIETGEMYTIDAYLDFIEFDESKTMYSVVIDDYYFDWARPKTYKFIVVKIVDNEVVELINEDILARNYIQCELEKNIVKLEYDAPQDNELWLLSDEVAIVTRGYDILSESYISIDNTQTLNRLTKDDHLNDTLIDLYLDENKERVKQVSYSEIKESIFTENASIRDGVIYYWFRITLEDGSEYLTFRTERENEKIAHEHIDVNFGDKTELFSETRYIYDDLLHLDLLLYQNYMEDIEGPGFYGWRCYSIENGETIDFREYGYDYWHNEMTISPSKAFISYFMEDFHSIYMHGITKNGMKYLMNVKFDDYRVYDYKWLSDYSLMLNLENSVGNKAMVSLIYENNQWELIGDIKATEEHMMVYEVVVDVDVLNMREGPSIDTPVVKKTSLGEKHVVKEVYLNDLNELWFLTNEDLWIINDYCRVIND